MILNGKVAADNIKQQLREEIEQHVNAVGRRPKLAIISVGDDPASKVYVRNKMKAAEEVGIDVQHYCFAADDEVEAVLHLIDLCNWDDKTDGIMVQLPLPEGWNERELIDAISPAKDVDGLTTTNIGRLRSGQDCLKPCTAAGIIDLLTYYGINLNGTDVAIVSRSNIVGKPLADMMMACGATVTQCHSRTNQLSAHTFVSNVVVSAVGKPKLLNHEYIRHGTIVVDVGINRDEKGKLCGDVDYEDVKDIAYAITPVPGGVGPMTVAELIRNVVEAWKKNNA